MRAAVLILLGALLISACSSSAPQRSSSSNPDHQQSVGEVSPTVPLQAPEDSSVEVRINPRVEDFEAHVPFQLVPRDGIRPVYEPKFSPAAEAPLKDDELVLGVAVGEEAKAYPVTILNFREMVNDELAGIPTLVTW